MLHMPGNQNVIAWAHRERFLILNFQYSLATHDHDPFIPRLIIPEALGAGLTKGSDALDFHTGFFKERGECFLGGFAFEVGE